MNTKRNTFSFRIIHAGSAFLFPDFISPYGQLKKHLVCVLHTVLFSDKPLFIKKNIYFLKK